ncbi:ornithine cyclodeaminase family protein [Lentibacillus halophilus]|uniref:Ornithine cyclodeaminase family protein n=1 Tax=Lentibacillus halophilus TaxID=295065 RepID=A0ABN0Z1L8_9BACI
MLFLSEQNMKQSVTMKDIIDAIDETYHIYESQIHQMPERMQVKDHDNTLLLMPCLTDDAMATKLVTVFPNNQEHPTLNGLVVLNSQETGEVKSVLNGTFLTGMRTGAVGGSAVRHLSDESASSLAVIGTGTQGFYQAIAACTERPIKDIYLHNRSKDKLESFKKSLMDWMGEDINVHIAPTPEEAINDADIVITATTSHDPVFPDSPHMLENKLFIGIGSFQPGMREFPQSLYTIADALFVDTEHAIVESGDMAVPLEKGWITKDSIMTMSRHIEKKTQINSDNNPGTTVFKSTGMALFDVVVANLIYKKALENNTGTKLSM